MTYADYEWFLEQDFSRYSGRWIAIVNKQVVAEGNEPAGVLAAVKRIMPKKKPLLTKVRNRLAILSS